MEQSRLKETSHFTLLDHHPDPTLYYTPVFANDGAIVDFELFYGNVAAAHGVGVEPAVLSGQKVLSVSWADEATRKSLFQLLLQVYQTGENSETTYYNPILEKHFRTIRRKIDDGVLTIARDVTAEFTERVEKERQLALSNLILNTSLNGWFACECIWDAKGVLVDFLITRVNPGFTRLTGYAEKDVVGKTYLSVFPSAKHNGAFDMNRRVFESGQTIRQQLRYEGDGLNAWYDVAMTVLGTNGILVTFADITETKNLAMAAEQSAQALQTVFNAAQTGMFTFAPEYNEEGAIVDFRFVMVNSAISAYTGKSAESLVGELGVKWFAGYLTNGEFDLYKRCFETGEPQHREIHYTSDGQDVYLYIQCVKIGKQLLVTLTDYSLLRRSQQNLEHTIKALERSNQNLADFARAASHDLKEPIRKIAVFADRLETCLGDRLKENEADMFERMQMATKRMTLLIDDLLTYSHVSLTTIAKEDVDLNRKLQLILSDLEVAIEEKQAVIEVDHLPVVKGYRLQLQQVFQNVLSNALKYSKPDVAPFIRVKARAVTGGQVADHVPPEKHGDHYCLIEVEDNGIGFDQQYAERIFQMFTRLHGNKEYTGSGVGLAIVQKVVENHNGFIWATSKPGEGATFHVLLPE